MNKGGIGSVVANVLVVLLVILGVSILWTVVRPLISSTGNRVQPDCFTLDLDVASCVYTGTASPYATTLTIKRGVGNGDVKAVKFVFSFASGNPVITPEVATNIDELETFSLPNSYSSIEVPQSVIVVPLVGEEKIVCTPSDNPTPCTQGP